MIRVRNDRFDPSCGLDRGRPFLTEAIWYLVKCVFFLSAIPWPAALKVRLLRSFGGRIGSGVVIKPRVNIHFPWKLSIGDHSWIGEEVFILNLEPVHIGSHVCISQRAFLCTGNHDYRRENMPYKNQEVIVESGAWVGANAFVAPGVTIRCEAVVTAGSVVLKNMPQGMVCFGNPCSPVKSRWK